MRSILIMLFLVLNLTSMSAQTEDCNKLGVWMWYFEITEFDTHQSLADSLSNMGIKRLYAKVADGSVNTTIWPELVDEELVDTYQNADLEIWGWSYNYPGNEVAQAEALYIAAQTGYQGYVVDVEMQFDGEPEAAEALFQAFQSERQRAINDGLIDENFKIYCTTWGNPKDHNFPISSIDPYVDAFMPQTYVELWGQSYIDDLTYWIEEGDREYEELGSTKPNHHIVAMENDIINAEEVDEFIQASGKETSVWRIPGGGTPISIWEQWQNIDWNVDFCSPTNTGDLKDNSFTINPNPVTFSIDVEDIDFDIFTISNNVRTIMTGRKGSNAIDVSELPHGYYILSLSVGDRVYSQPFIKM